MSLYLLWYTGPANICWEITPGLLVNFYFHLAYGLHISKSCEHTLDLQRLKYIHSWSIDDQMISRTHFNPFIQELWFIFSCEKEYLNVIFFFFKLQYSNQKCYCRCHGGVRDDVHCDVWMVSGVKIHEYLRKKLLNNCMNGLNLNKMQCLLWLYNCTGWHCDYDYD